MPELSAFLSNLPKYCPASYFFNATMPHPHIIRDANPADFAQILALNEESVRFLSPMDAPRLALLHSQATYHRVVEFNGQVGAFMMAHRNGSAYDSTNFHWFAQRYLNFLYIDRITVSASLQGQGIGKLFYEDLFAFTRNTGTAFVTCEFDIDPPNPTSEKFHRAFGFKEVGTQTYGASNKRVALQALELGSTKR
jgi:uncharacterized protein